MDTVHHSSGCTSVSSLSLEKTSPSGREEPTSFKESLKNLERPLTFSSPSSYWEGHRFSNTPKLSAHSQLPRSGEIPALSSLLPQYLRSASARTFHAIR